MSQRLNDDKHFLILLLNGNKDQSNALLDTITKSQTLTLLEIFMNLYNLPVSNETKTLLKKRKRFFSLLCRKKGSLSGKKQLIQRHRLQVLDTLMSVKQDLINLLS